MRADAPRPTPATDSMMWVLLAESSPSHMIGRVMRLANEAKPRRKRTGPRSHQRMRNTRYKTVARAPVPIVVAACFAPALSRARLAWPRSLARSEEHTSELQSRENLVCRLLL